jgi:GNAT superfamily N-acetyltransferase
MIAKIKAPKGYKFKITKYKYGDKKNSYDVHVKLYHEGFEIGNVELIQQDNGKYETHSQLDYGYRGQKLGVTMYARAIQWCLDHGYKVSSSGQSSEMAQRVWKSKTLRKFFRITKEIPQINRNLISVYANKDNIAMWRAYAKE